ncbi:hypothetical protein P7K49_004437, partial [Saguinus oedipus]
GTMKTALLQTNVQLCVSLNVTLQVLIACFCDVLGEPLVAKHSAPFWTHHLPPHTCS